MYVYLGCSDLCGFLFGELCVVCVCACVCLCMCWESSGLLVGELWFVCLCRGCGLCVCGGILTCGFMWGFWLVGLFGGSGFSWSLN